MNYLKTLVEDIHSVVIATNDRNGRPVTRVIDMMLYDDQGVYFLTAKGKEFYEQLTNQKYVSLTGVKDKKSISLAGKIRNIGNEKLNEIFEKNTYMQKIYPGDTRSALDVFVLYVAQGQYFDISDPAHIERGVITIGDIKASESGYFVSQGCIGCKKCLEVCPQKCIDFNEGVAVINQQHCLHCGRCIPVCPVNCIKYR